jgi:hypothetical protein
MLMKRGRTRGAERGAGGETSEGSEHQAWGGCESRRKEREGPEWLLALFKGWRPSWRGAELRSSTSCWRKPNRRPLLGSASGTEGRARERPRARAGESDDGWKERETGRTSWWGVSERRWADGGSEIWLREEEVSSRPGASQEQSIERLGLARGPARGDGEADLWERLRTPPVSKAGQSHSSSLFSPANAFGHTSPWMTTRSPASQLRAV